MAFYLDNAISWAQFRLRGGWKNLLVIAGCYAAGAVFFIALPYELENLQGGRNYVLEFSSTLILASQVVMFLLLGGMAVSGSLRRDVANRLMESHRLMPLSPVQAVVGYIAGAGLQVLSLCLVNLLLGAVLFRMRGIPVQTWLISNGLLFGFSMAIWTAMAMAAFVSRAISGLLLVLFISIMFSGGFIFVVVPGLLAFCSPMHGSTIFDVTVLSKLSTGTVVAVGAQLLMCVLCIRGAARKYADANAVSLTMGPSLAALGIWAGLSWFGIYDFQELRPRMLGYAHFDWRLLVVGAIASCLLVAMLPLAAAAWSDILRRQRRLDGDKPPSDSGRLGFCLCVAMLFALTPLTSSFNSTIVHPPQYFYPNAPAPMSAIARQRLATTRGQYRYAIPSSPPSYPVHVVDVRAEPQMIAAVCAIFLLQTYVLMRLLYPVIRRANALILLLIAVLWFVPLFADVIYYGTRNQNPNLDVFALYSPLGTMAQALHNPVPGTWPGIVAQSALCLFLAVIFFMVEFRRARGLPTSVGRSPDPSPSLGLPPHL